MAKAQAQWGKHKFLISSNQLNPMGDFSTSSEAKASDSKSKKKKTELETYTLTETCHSAAGADPVAHYNSLARRYRQLQLALYEWEKVEKQPAQVAKGLPRIRQAGRLRSHPVRRHKFDI